MNKLKKRIYVILPVCLLLSSCVSNSYQEKNIPDESLVQGRPSLKYPNFRLGVLPEPTYVGETKTK